MRFFSLLSAIAVNLLFCSSISQVDNTTSEKKLEVKSNDSVELIEDSTYSELDLSFEEVDDFLPVDISRYFSRLSAYSPSNDNGTCSYVSLIQLLSYYDTEFCDEIIPEAYDYASSNLDVSMYYDMLTSSPGVIREDYETVGITRMERDGIYDATYDQYIEYSKSYNFQSYLISKYTEYEKLYNDYQEETNICSIDINNYQNLLDYVYGDNMVSADVLFFDNPSVAYSEEKQLEFENYIKSNIDSGKPVVVHIASEIYSYEGELKRVGHAVVAYDYDDDGIIYSNYGYGHSDTHSNLLSSFYCEEAGRNLNYEKIIGAMTLEFEGFSEVHSNNYVFDNLNYCGCGEHVHNFISTYIPDSCFQHMSQCLCGEAIPEEHVGENNSCEYCGTSYTFYELDFLGSESNINGLNLSLRMGSYNNSNIPYLFVDYEWKIKPDVRIVDYIVVYWTYGLSTNSSKQFIGKTFIDGTLTQSILSYIELFEYGNYYKEIAWGVSISPNYYATEIKGNAIIEFEKISNSTINFEVRYYHSTNTIIAQNGIKNIDDHLCTDAYLIAQNNYRITI